MPGVAVSPLKLGVASGAGMGDAAYGVRGIAFVLGEGRPSALEVGGRAWGRGWTAAPGLGGRAAVWTRAASVPGWGAPGVAVSRLNLGVTPVAGMGDAADGVWELAPGLGVG